MSSVQIYSDVCGQIKINFPLNVTSSAQNQFIDSDSRYFLVSAPELDSQIEVILDIIPPNQDYDGFGMFANGTDTVQRLNVIDGGPAYTIETDVFVNTLSTFSSRKYSRNEDKVINQSYPDGGYSNNTFWQWFNYVEFVDYEFNPNGELVRIEGIAGTIIKSGETAGYTPLPGGGQIFLSTTGSYPTMGLITINGNPINPETGEVLTGYRLRVNLLGEYPQQLAQYEFLSDPRPLVVQCLTQECPDGCIALYDGSFENKMCICQPVDGVPVVDEWPNLDQDSSTWDSFD